MTERARFQNSYRTRYLVLSGVCLLLAAWFGYDGFIGYPQQMEYAEAYDPLLELNSAERTERWQKITEENGWPDRVPTKRAEQIAADIIGQYFWMGLNLLVGLPALYLLLRSRGSWIEETPTGLKTSWGQELDFSQVTSLNKKKWAAKGIAKANYLDQGTPRVFVFDDFKYEREPLGKMLRRLESQLEPAQIVGGPPESTNGTDPLPKDASQLGPPSKSDG